MNKVYEDARAALHDVTDGVTILAGGFGLSGNPENCITELARKKVGGLTIVSNNCGTTDKGLGVLLAQADEDGDLDWTVSVDSTINRAHQHATNTRRPDNATGGSVESQEPDRPTQ